MSAECYRLLHILGILMLFSGLVGLWGLFAAGNPLARGRRLALAAMHGVGLLLLAVSGLARAGQLGLMPSLPIWIYAKFLIWLALGASVVFAKRKPQWGLGLVASWVGLGLVAAYLGLFKPT